MEGAGLWAGEVRGVGVPILATSFCWAGWPVPSASTSNTVPRKHCWRQQRAIIPMRHQKKLQHLNVILNPRKETSLLLWFTVSPLELWVAETRTSAPFSPHRQNIRCDQSYDPTMVLSLLIRTVLHSFATLLWGRYTSLFPRYSLHFIVVSVHISPLSWFQEKWFLKLLIG